MKPLHSVILGEGPPLLILHGYLGMGDNWRTLGKRFAESFQVHLIDQRNHGRSFHSEAFDYELLVDDLLNYMSFHQLSQVHLLGHSMGGKVAMLLAVSHPEKVRKLVVADIAPKYYPPHHQQILSALNAVDFSIHNSRQKVEELLKTYIEEAGVRQFLLKNVYRKTWETLAFRFHLQSLTTHYNEVGTPLPSFSHFDGDTLFLKGAHSTYILADDQALIEAHFSKAVLRTISRAGHWLHAENPAQFFQEVSSFLSEGCVSGC
ncbi:MAG: alpha/beta fold hydrolase [Lutibacter sp.]|jgi:pimeloyl-ACP methyl ester carboxylesterase|nr:alpha/beta fold hydrolase [Lutibacter sp.]